MNGVTDISAAGRAAYQRDIHREYTVPGRGSERKADSSSGSSAYVDYLELSEEVRDLLDRFPIRTDPPHFLVQDLQREREARNRLDSDAHESEAEQPPAVIGESAQTSRANGEDATEEGEEEPGDLTPEEEEQVAELEQTDREVRAHEESHVAAGGAYVSGGIQYEYQTGPDSKRYAVGGEVNIDTSRERTPEETIRKANVIRQAALAPADPSGQDISVAAAASQMLIEAQRELAKNRADEADGKTSQTGATETGSRSASSPESTGKPDQPAGSREVSPSVRTYTGPSSLEDRETRAESEYFDAFG